MTYATAQWCRSRRGRALCTRPTGHVGLHNRVGTSQMWSDAQADPPQCPGGGTPASASPRLDDGFPGGRARCPECDGFVALQGAVIAEHAAFRGTADALERAHRAEWFNRYGWI